MRTTITSDKHCDEDARYEACFYISPNDDTWAELDRAVVEINLSCFGATRKQAKTKLKDAINLLLDELETELEELK